MFSTIFKGTALGRNTSGCKCFCSRRGIIGDVLDYTLGEAQQDEVFQSQRGGNYTFDSEEAVSN
jgi:hypothetical protein